MPRSEPCAASAAFKLALGDKAAPNQDVAKSGHGEEIRGRGQKFGGD